MPSRVTPLLLRGLLFLTAAAFAALPATEPRPAHAAAYLVTTLADSGPGSLRQAILDANATPGADTITFGLSGTITLASSLPDITDPAGLMIDGTGQSVVVSGGGYLRPMNLISDARLMLQHLRMTLGFGSQAGALLSRGALTLRQVTFEKNKGNVAGAVSVEGGTLDVFDCVFTENEGGNDGALSIRLASANIVSSTFARNRAAFGGAAIGYSAPGAVLLVQSSIVQDNVNTTRGPALKLGGGTTTFADSEITGTQGRGITVASDSSVRIERGRISGNQGTGIDATGNVTVVDSWITSNTAVVGAGITMQGADVSLLRTLVADNVADRGGGGVYQDLGQLTVSQSSLVRNRTLAPAGAPPPFDNLTGGAGILSHGTVEITNSTISSNTSASRGGGLMLTGSIANLSHVTIAENQAVGGGGGLYIFGLSPLVTGTVLSNSGATSPDCAGSMSSLGANLVTSQVGCTITGTPPIVADPLLGPLADNGGPTLTHALLPGSPAIDAGDDAICAGAPVSGVDQRGVKRPQGAHCDIGAYERQVGVPLVNGDFEAGATGWTLAGLTDGIARVETQGSCFGANNTLGITFAGDRALNVRSSASAPAGSTGIATSSAFTLGGSLSFRALVENDDAVPAPDPVAFEVRILDEVGGVRATHSVKPSVLTTSPGTSNDGCLVGDLRDGPWSTHTIDTSAFAGQTGRVEFRQHTKVPGKGFFALVDDVVVLPEANCDAKGAGYSVAGPFFLARYVAA